jgi:sRNA-binding protein
MPNVDLNAAIRKLVAAEVDRTLEPYQQMLERLVQLLGQKPARRGPGRPPKAAGARRGRKARKARKGGKGDASRFREGQVVKYRQGRGEFEATVLAVDVENNSVKLERKKDGKKVERPATKIY